MLFAYTFLIERRWQTCKKCQPTAVYGCRIMCFLIWVLYFLLLDLRVLNKWNGSTLTHHCYISMLTQGGQTCRGQAKVVKVNSPSGSPIESSLQLTKGDCICIKSADVIIFYFYLTIQLTCCLFWSITVETTPEMYNSLVVEKWQINVKLFRKRFKNAALTINPFKNLCQFSTVIFFVKIAK